MSDGTTSLSFTYNADGQRVSKTVGGVTYNYVYAGSTLTDIIVAIEANPPLKRFQVYRAR